MLKIDFKKISKGDTFIDIYENEENILNAINAGAVCVICKKGNYDVKTINVKDPLKYLADYLKELYNYKIKHLKLITLACDSEKMAGYFAYQIFNSSGIKCSYISDDVIFFDDKKEKIDNLNLYTLYDYLVMISDNTDIVILNVSHNLINELKGLSFDLVCATGLNEDVTNLLNQVKGKKINLLSSDEKNIDNFILSSNNLFTFGFKKSDYRLKKLSLNFDKTSLNILSNDILYSMNIPFFYKSNAYSFLIAYAICNLFGLKEEEIVGFIPELKLLPGKIDGHLYKENLIIIDESKSEKEVLNILKETKEYNPSSIITVIGSDALMSKEERKKIGMVVLKNSDKVIFTNDNPREESEEEIINDMIGEGNYEIIYSRKEAIQKAINLLDKNDILLILGRGDAEYQKIGLEDYYLKDSEVVLKYIK